MQLKRLEIAFGYNCEDMKNETLRILEGVIDIYMPDFKYLQLSGVGKYSGQKIIPKSKTALKEMTVRWEG